MIRYRPFRNTDPPALAELWCRQPPMRGLGQPVSTLLLDRHVLAKPYFDRNGLIVALDGKDPVGFVHAGFGPADDMSSLSTELGVTCMLLVAPEADRETVAAELLARSERYLSDRGARVLYGGGIFPLNPFYLGLYGGSELPGVLVSDESATALYRASDYREADRCIAMQHQATDGRPTMDRRLVQNRRRFRIDATFDPRSADWWEACTLGATDRTQFELRPRDGDDVLGRVTFWDMEPLAGSWGVHAVGLVQLEIDPSVRRQGLATFLVSEAMRQLSAYGVTVVEAQAMHSNKAALALYRRLGFTEVDEGIVFRKEG